MQVTKTVIEKTNNIVNQTKLKFSISETKSKIKDIYTEIGKSVYDNYKSTGEVIDDMEEKFAKIDAMTEEVNEQERFICAQKRKVSKNAVRIIILMMCTAQSAVKEFTT